jgi:TRAP transporter TAXI family solute receptor
VKVLAGLFAEDVHLVAAAKSRIRAMSDLKGKRVSIGADDSGTNVTARAVLAAYGLSSRNVQTAYDSVDDEVEDIQQGKLDAFFFVGATPVPLLSDLIARGVVRLVPVDGKGRQRLMKAVPDIEPATIPANTYAGTGSVETVRVRAIWIVRDSTPNPLTYGILRALFAPANRNDLDSAMPATHAIRLEDAARNLPAPLHPGAMRFFRETGNFSPPAKPGKI